MRERELNVNWTAAFLGFGVDWAFSLPTGLLVSFIMLTLRGQSLESEVWPADVLLASQVIGVVGAVLGGGVAGYVAQQRGALHGVLSSAFSLLASFCWFGMAINLGDLGFIILNFVAAGYGGRAGERLRMRRRRGR